METAGDLIPAAAELAAGVEDSKHHLQSGFTGLGLDVNRDAPAVVGYSDGVARVDGHGDVGAVTGQGLVDGVVHNLIYQVVQAGLRGGADIHARPLAHRLQALQDLDFRPAVLVVGLCGVQFVQFVPFFRHSYLRDGEIL